MTRRALLEDPRLPTPVMPPETLYLELTVGQMSAQETTLFEFPCIGDDLNERDRNGDHKFTLDLLRTTVDQCSNPPAFRGVKTPITDLLDQEPFKSPRDNDHKRSPQSKDNNGKLQSRATKKSKTTAAKSGKTVRFDQVKKTSQRPSHEKPSCFPKGLKRPDLNASVDGNKIASEFQRQLYDDIKDGNCIRCHSKDHAR